MLTPWPNRLAKRQLPVLAFFFLILLAAAPASAQIPVTTCGTVINGPGDYALANDLDCPENGIIIRNTDGVILELMQHTISGTPPFSGIEVDSSEADIRGGYAHIKNFENGILIHGYACFVIVEVTFADNNQTGFRVEDYAKGIFRYNNALNNDVGFEIAALASRYNEISGNKVRYNQTGIRLDNDLNNVFNNDVIANGYGIVAMGMYNIIKTNGAEMNREYDLFDATECRNDWIDNTFKTANRKCIH